jgi:hypothetical protein
MADTHPTATKPVEKHDTKHEEKATGPLKPGEVGYVTLDAEGKASGTPTREPPKDTPCARVVGVHPASKEEYVTPSGAPVSGIMNPEHNYNLMHGLPTPQQPENTTAKK